MIAGLVPMRVDVLRRAEPAPPAEHQQVRQRVAAEPVAAVHPARALPRGEQARDRRHAGVRVDLDPAHHVVAGGADLHRLLRDVDIGQLLELVVHRRQLLEDLLRRPPGGDVEEHAAVRAAPAGLDLGVDRAGDLVARQQLGRTAVVVRVGVPAVALGLGRRVLVAEHVRDVVEHEPLALGVAQHPAVAADGLGDEDPLHRRRPDHAGRVELQELHVDQRRARTQGQRVPVAGVLPGVAGHLVALADPARGQHDRRRVEADEAPVAAEVAEAAGDLPVRHQQLRDRALVEDPDVRLVVAGGLVVLLLQRDDLLLQGADQLQAGAVTDVRQPRVVVPAEVALADLAVLGAVEQRAVGLELPDPVRRLLGVQLGHPPVVEELPAAHGVAVVDLPVVVGIDVAHRRGAATLGHHRVGLAEQRLRDDRRALALHAGLDRGAQPRPARADHDHVVVVPLDRFTVDVLGHARHPTIRRSEIHPAETAMM